MKHSAVIAAAAGLASASLTVRQTGAAAPQDSNGVCSGPNMACSDIQNIQTDCDAKANNDKTAHGACMCKDGALFFKKWEECRRCLADNNMLTQQELAGWLACNSKAQADICSGNPSDLYPKVFETLFPGEGGTCSGGQSQGQTPGASGTSGAPGAGASQTAAVTTGSSTASTSTASGTVSTGSASTGSASTGSVSTGSVATGVVPSTGSSREGSSASASASASSSPASTAASTTGSRNSTSSSSRSGASNAVVNAAASPKAAFASVLAVVAAGAGFFMAL